MLTSVYRWSVVLLLVTGCSLGGVERRISFRVGDDEAVHLVRSSGNKDCCDGVLHLDNRDYEAALVSFEDAVRTDPADWRAHFGMGLAYEAQGRLDEATAAYNQANCNSRSPQECIRQARKRVVFMQNR